MPEFGKHQGRTKHCTRAGGSVDLENNVLRARRVNAVVRFQQNILMKPFPEQYELIGFFEVEPQVTDRDVPWFYNRLTFRTQRGEDTIYCAIEPGYGQLVFIWERQSKPVISLILEEIESLQVKTEHNLETLVAKFKIDTGVMDFELQLRPHVNVKWGNQARI